MIFKLHDQHYQIRPIRLRLRHYNWRIHRAVLIGCWSCDRPNISKFRSISIHTAVCSRMAVYWPGSSSVFRQSRHFLTTSSAMRWHSMIFCKLSASIKLVLFSRHRLQQHRQHLIQSRTSRTRPRILPNPHIHQITTRYDVGALTTSAAHTHGFNGFTFLGLNLRQPEKSPAINRSPITLPSRRNRARVVHIAFR